MNQTTSWFADKFRWFPDNAQDISAGFFSAVPMMLGYIPLSFAFGVLADSAGFSTFNTLLMSCLVYAGSSQVVAVPLLIADAAPLAVVATTFVINLRHLLMSSALAPYLRHYNRWLLALFGFTLTDEVFAIHSANFKKNDASYAKTFATNIALYIAWQVGTILGVLVHASPELMLNLGLDYAPVAMMIALLVLLISNKLQLLVALCCGLVAIACNKLGMGPWSIIVATSISATIGMVGTLWTSKKSL